MSESLDELVHRSDHTAPLGRQPIPSTIPQQTERQKPALSFTQSDDAIMGVNPFADLALPLHSPSHGSNANANSKTSTSLGTNHSQPSVVPATFKVDYAFEDPHADRPFVSKQQQAYQKKTELDRSQGSRGLQGSSASGLAMAIDSAAPARSEMLSSVLRTANPAEHDPLTGATFNAPGSMSSQQQQQHMYIPAAKKIQESPAISLTGEEAQSTFSSSQINASAYNITVSDPQKIQKLGSTTYTLYKVSTIYTRIPHGPHGQAEFVELVVARRYSDFALLSEQLVAAHPGAIVPGVPEKQAFGRFDDKFVEARRRSLEIFLKKIVAHPLLAADAFVQLFLECNEPYADQSHERPRVYQLKMRSDDRDEWFEARMARIDGYEVQLKTFARAISGFQRRLDGMTAAHGEFCEALSMLCEIENPQTVGKCLGRLSDTHRQVAQYIQDIKDIDIAIIGDTVDQQIRTISSTRTAYRTRAGCFSALQSLSKQQRNRNQASDDSVAIVLERTRQDFECISTLLRSEIERVDYERVGEINRSLRVCAESISVHQKAIVTLWEEYYAILVPRNAGE